MITNVFKKSTPIIYSLIIVLVVSFFFLYQFQTNNWSNSVTEILKKTGLLFIICGSFFLSNFIAKKNGLTKDSSYTILFYLILLLSFPSIWNNFNLIVSNFFILLALRRLVSLQTLKAPKEKIFDASLWIFMASFFQFWAILFIFIVYLSIIFHVSRDYRNWLVPFVALFSGVIIFVFFALLLDKSFIMYNYIENSSMSFDMDYFENNYQNIALSWFAILVVFFFFATIFSLTKLPLNLQASYKKIVFSFLIGIAIFIISPNKSNDILIFTFFPLAIMATNFIEYSQNKIHQEIILATTFIVGLICFFTQL